MDMTTEYPEGLNPPVNTDRALTLIVQRLMADTAATQHEYITGDMSDDEMKAKLVVIGANAVADILEITDAD